MGFCQIFFVVFISSISYGQGSFFCSYFISNHNASNLVFNESTLAGTRLYVFDVEVNATVQLTAEVVSPQSLATLLKGHFRLERDIITKKPTLYLATKIDTDDLFQQTNTIPNDMEMKISCKDNLGSQFFRINITVIDVDDNGPDFDMTSSGACALPVFSVTVQENYIGELETDPKCVCAHDGDLLINNTVLMSFLHGDPPEYKKFFHIDGASGRINKTRKTGKEDPRSFTFVVEAKEVSPISRSKVAVLTVGIDTEILRFETLVREADPFALKFLQFLSAFVLVGLTISFAIVVRHRATKVKAVKEDTKVKTNSASRNGNGIVYVKSIRPSVSDAPKLKLDSIEEET